MTNDSPPTHEPLPYSSGSADAQITVRATAHAVRTGILLMIGWILIVGAGVFVTPWFEKMFRGYKVELPGITKMTLAFSRWLANDYGWLMILPIVLGTPFALYPLFRAQVVAGRELRWRWINRFAYLAIVLLIGLYVLAVALPVVTLITTVSGSGGK